MRRISPLWLATCAAVWWFLAAPQADAWVAGGTALLVGVLLHVGLGGRSRARPRVRGALRFAPFFAKEMILGGLDVSRRALSPSLPLDPGLVHYRTGLPEGLARVFFINSISLLPGTFSARVDREEITVHRLDPESGPEDVLRELEARVAGLFGLELEGGTDG